jgi:hypothetical protein
MAGSAHYRSSTTQNHYQQMRTSAKFFKRIARSFTCLLPRQAGDTDCEHIRSPRQVTCFPFYVFAFPLCSPQRHLFRLILNFPVETVAQVPTEWTEGVVSSSSLLCWHLRDFSGCSKCSDRAFGLALSRVSCIGGFLKGQVWASPYFVSLRPLALLAPALLLALLCLPTLALALLVDSWLVCLTSPIHLLSLQLFASFTCYCFLCLC